MLLIQEGSQSRPCGYVECSLCDRAVAQIQQPIKISKWLTAPLRVGLTAPLRELVLGHMVVNACLIELAKTTKGLSPAVYACSPPVIQSRTL